MSEEKTDRIVQLLEELLKWKKFEGLQTARTVIIELLKTDTEKLIYQNSDGRTSREIASVVGVSHATVANYWKKWVPYGVVEEVSSRGSGSRYKRVFSLSDFGLEVARIPPNLQSEEDKEGK